MIRQFEQAGFEATADDPDDVPDALVVAFDMTLTYSRLCRATWWAAQGIPYIATNPDWVCPTDQRTILVDCGSLQRCIEAASGRKPDIVLGKPDPTMLDGIRERNDLEAGEIAMVGDRIYTDIAMGHNAGAITVLVLSGETTLETALQVAEEARDNPHPEFFPADFIVRDIRELGELLLESHGMKILFIHGLASSGTYKWRFPRILLKPCKNRDVPIEPAGALRLLEGICREQRPDLVVGLSLGGFWAQKLRGRRKILVNPDFHVSRLLRTMVGVQDYRSPRADGAKTLRITETICREYEDLERSQFEALPSEEVRLTSGLFADRDEWVRCGEEFERHYPGRGISPGRTCRTTLPKAHLVPLVDRLNLR